MDIIWMQCILLFLVLLLSIIVIIIIIIIILFYYCTFVACISCKFMVLYKSVFELLT